MTLSTFSTSQEAQQAAALLEGYHFELGNHDAPQWVSLWLEFYRPAWIRDAVIESLYQGRYKAFSVRQILELWERRGDPIRHTTHDFEVTVCKAYGGAKLGGPSTIKPAATAFAQPSNQVSGQISVQAPSRQKASLRTHQSLSNISFNLSDEWVPPTASQPNTEADAVIAAGNNGRSSRAMLAETAKTLQAEQQADGTRYTNSRGIQPFKPALPFSAQTLRLAKQKALAMAESR